MEIMIDLETMGTSARAPILSLGAVAFSFDRPVPPVEETVHLHFNVDLRTQQGRQPDGDTVYWWLRQSDEARAALQVPPALSIQDALLRFREWVIGLKSGNPSITYWSFGANFDHVLLNDAYNQYGVSNPMPFRNQLCCRTYMDLATRLLGWKMFDVKGAPRHTALGDAYKQAVWMQDIVSKLRQGLNR